MQSSGDARILIVDDEELICRLLENALFQRGMPSESLSRAAAVLDRIRERCFDVMLLDVQIHDACGLTLIPEIKERCPETKVIIMTGYADKETAIKALRLGAFDFLEKPFELEIPCYVVSRALQAIEKERSVVRLIQDLKRSKAELLNHKDRLEKLNDQLLETNKALSVLARNIDCEREQMERRIALKLKSLIIPAIERLQCDKSLTKYELELSMIVKQVEDLTVGFGTDMVIASSLSFSELRIASLVKNGLTSEEIAKHLNIAPSTVRTHRKNIRRKLKINNAQHSLRNYLHSLRFTGFTRVKKERLDQEVQRHS